MNQMEEDFDENKSQADDILATENNEGIQLIQETASKVKQEIQKVIVGQDMLSDFMLAAIFCKGHVLLEGVPGIAKTLAVRLLARTVSAGFKRIQFTPDLMPSDVVGTTLYNMKTSDFSFREGPVFSNIILTDEINRAPAKTQAALFEVMEERQVTVDGQTYKMEEPFIIVATQNPIEQEGTYKLPEAQLDRFIFKIKLNYPSLEEEQTILKRFKSDFNLKLEHTVNTVLEKDTIGKCSQIIEQVYVKDELLKYIAIIVNATRNSTDLFLGASPRASLAILKASKAFAAINGRNFITPDDIRTVSKPVLNHRIILNPEKEMEGYTEEIVIDAIIESIEVPR